MAATIVKDSHPDDQFDLLKAEGVSLESLALNFQALPGNRNSTRSGQLRGSPTKMLPPVRFNILGKMQRRKSPSPGSQCDSKKSRDSPPHDGETTGQGVQNTPHKRSSFQLTSELELAPSSNRERPRAADSPLDFSKKPKLDPRLLKIYHSQSENLDDSPPSPSSHLRNILSMKCQAESDSTPEKVLNLSKESSTSPAWPLEKLSHQNESISADSSSCSPVLVESRNSQTLPPSPGTDITLKSEGLPVCSSKPLFPIANNSATHMNFAPYGIFPPVSSAHRVNQSMPNFGLSLPLENNATNFPPNLPVNPVHLPASLALPPGDASSKGRITRPFKAYPKDPMSFSTVGLYGLPLGTMPGTTEALIHQQSNAAYAEFRKQMLSQSNVSRKRRSSHRGILPCSIDSKGSSNQHTFSFENESNDGPSSPDGMTGVGKTDGKSEQQMKDEAYWERRRKNNEAAKRSRDARRAKEDEIAIRAAFLEQENLKLRFELCALKNETAKLRCMLYSS